MMKKINYLFAALLFLGFVSLSSCKSTTKPETQDATTEEVEEVVEVEVETTDTVAVEDTLTKEEEVEEQEAAPEKGM